MAERIEDYGLIGDLQTAALVSRHGSVDWLCFPRFDSGACFAALLGDDENGSWSLGPVGEVTGSSRRYRGDTLILETELETADGTVRLIDFMPPRGEAPDVVRIVEGVEGTVAMQMRIDDPVRLRLDRPVGAKSRRRPAGRRRSGRAAARDSDRARGPRLPHVRRVRGRPGRPRAIRAHLVPVAPIRLPATSTRSRRSRTPRSSGREWVRSCVHVGRFRDALVRSLVTLKALTYAPTGGIVAAPTTSLPESARRPAELGLPLLLAARRDVDAPGAHPRGVRGRGRRVARLAPAGDRRPPRGDPDHVRDRGRAAADRARARLARRVRGLAARPHRQRRVATSSSSTCTARSPTPSTTHAGPGSARRLTPGR